MVVMRSHRESQTFALSRQRARGRKKYFCYSLLVNVSLSEKSFVDG
jgi:hypothetical protein